MKTFIIYYEDSYTKYEELYVKYFYELTEDKLIKVYKRDSLTGEEILISCFKNWSYFLIESD